MEGFDVEASIHTSAPDITWDKLDKPRFFSWGALLFLGVRGLTYPISLVKTRLQVGGETGGFATVRTLRNVVRHEGVRALYQGFTLTALGALPGQIVYLSTMESTKLVMRRFLTDVVGWQSNQGGRIEFVAGGVGGGVGSLVTQVVMVPVDVVAQRLMIQRRRALKPEMGLPATSVSSSIPKQTPIAASPSTIQPSTGRALAVHIIRTEGVSGLYRGFWTSMFTYAPSSAIWWGTHGLAKRLLTALFHPVPPLTPSNPQITTAPLPDSDDGPTTWQILPISAFSGLLAGTITALVTNPLDVIKTRLQALPSTSTSKSEWGQWRHTAAELIAADGWVKGLSRGIGARCVNMGLTSILMITTYETVKDLSLKT
ncbi:mitochondrial carrier domain-containing protein [Phlyctochytrium arcticum]|nr:mitochondrial carrier domain-containing protein [Phlyctochytrium arcticum]